MLAGNSIVPLKQREKCFQPFDIRIIRVRRIGDALLAQYATDGRKVIYPLCFLEANPKTLWPAVANPWLPLLKCIEVKRDRCWRE